MKFLKVFLVVFKFLVGKRFYDIWLLGLNYMGLEILLVWVCGFDDDVG